MMQTNIKILIVDDDEIDRLRVIRAFRRGEQSIICDEAADEETALNFLSQSCYDCLLLDYRLGGSDGLALMERIQRLDLSVAPIIILSGLDNERVMLNCLKAGAQDYLLKSELTTNTLMRAIRYARERKQVAEQLRFIAQHDPLTGLANRTLFMSGLAQAIARTNRTHHYMAVFFIDLDHFKEVNDTLGHDVGDTLLKMMAERINASVRKTDLVSRFGGDEFAVLIDDFPNKEDVIEIAENTLKLVGQVLQIQGKSIQVTPSIGIALYPSGSENAEDVIKCADMAMYHAKKIGRNNFCFYAKEMHQIALHHTSLKVELTKALERKEFELFYQPQIDINTGTINGVEALIRWNHPERGLVGPAEFIPMAEETGLILAIGEWALFTACQQLKSWHDSKLIGETSLTLSVNVSAYQLKQSDIVGLVKTALTKYGIQSQQLVLELTESMLIEDIERCAMTLNSIADLGVRVAIDDFGTGYASFRHMLRLPLSYLKIDKSFVANVSTDKKNAEIVTAIISMAAALGLDVIAEGVETNAQAKQLESSGCKMQQGYLFAKPVPSEEMAALLRPKAPLDLRPKTLQLQEALSGL